MFKILVEIPQVQDPIQTLATLLPQQEVGAQQVLGWEALYHQVLRQPMLQLHMMFLVLQEQPMLEN